MTNQPNEGAPSAQNSEATKALATLQDAAKLTKKTKAEIELDQRRQKIQLDKAEKVATQSTSIFDPVAFAQMKQLAADLIAGGASSRDADTPEKLLVKLQAGFELGMTPIQSQNSLYIVNGRVTIWGAALIARLRQQGWQVRYKDEDATKSTISVFRDGPTGAEEIEDTFYYQDAVDSGYTQGASGEKIGWRHGQNRKLKLRYGAAAQLVKTYLPEVLAGQNIGVAEIDGEVIEAQIVEPEDAQAARVARIQAAENVRKGYDKSNFNPQALKPAEEAGSES